MEFVVDCLKPFIYLALTLRISAAKFKMYTDDSTVQGLYQPTLSTEIVGL